MSINGIKFADAEPLHFRYGERLRINLINDTMMTHPIHLHGMWSDLETGNPEHIPRKHTVIVQPGSKVSYLVTADAKEAGLITVICFITCWECSVRLLLLKRKQSRRRNLIQNYSHCYTAILMLLCFCYPVTAVGMKDDDPVLTKIIFDQLEVRHTDGHDLISADIEGWIGKDLHKFWFKNDFESSGGETEENEWQFLYNRAVDANWDFQIGWRKDIRPKPQRDWLVIGFQGTAPYELEVETTLFHR